MITLDQTTLRNCHICRVALVPNPAYAEGVVKTCERHGDFFLQQHRDRNPVVVYRPFDADDLKAPAPAKRRRPGYPKTTVRCDQTGVIYPSVQEAAKALGCNRHSLTKHLRGLQPTLRGLTYSRIIYDEFGVYHILPRQKVPTSQLHPAIRLVCNETGIVYDSIKQAARDLQIDRSNVYTYLTGKTNRSHVSGYTFTKLAEGESS